MGRVMCEEFRGRRSYSKLCMAGSVQRSASKLCHGGCTGFQEFVRFYELPSRSRIVGSYGCFCCLHVRGATGCGAISRVVGEPSITLQKGSWFICPVAVRIRLVYGPQFWIHLVIKEQVRIGKSVISKV